MTADAELIEAYVRAGSESAFAELVRRHVNLVYGAALRQTGGDEVAAQDVTQTVFTELARKARTLLQHPVLGGWLYTCTRHVASNLRRTELRRQHREQTALLMNQPNVRHEAHALWEELQSVLDDAMEGLNEKDRQAVILRFFQECSLREVGQSLGLSENAARMRVDRALDKLRGLLAQHGVTSTVSGLAAALGVAATIHAPLGLAATVASVALATVSAAMATSTSLTSLMTLTKTQLSIAALLLTTAVGLPLWQQTRLERLRQDRADLEAQLAPLPAMRTELAALRQVKVDHDELERLRNQEQELKLEVARLRGQLGVALAAEMRAQAAPPAPARTAADTSTETPALNAVVRTAMQTAVERQTIAKLPRLSERLKLSQDQQSALSEILNRQMTNALAAAEKSLSGKLTRADLQHLQASGGNPESEIDALLTPEQKVAYQEYKDEEAGSTARLAANAELLQMQPELGLTQEQQDQVFQALYDYTLAQLTGKLAMPDPRPRDVGSSMRWFLDQKAAALEGVLTPTQLEQYRKIQEDQAKLLQSFMPKE